MSASESAVRKRARLRGYRLRKDDVGTFSVIEIETGFVLQCVQDAGVMVEYRPGAWIDHGDGPPYLAWEETSGPFGLRLSLDEVDTFASTGETQWGGFRTSSN